MWPAVTKPKVKLDPNYGGESKMNVISFSSSTAITCPNDQVYKVCSNPCTRTCRSLATADTCTPTCVEGCTCPDGMTLDDSGLCVDVLRCPCIFDGREYPVGYTTLKGTDIWWVAWHLSSWLFTIMGIGHIMIAQLIKKMVDLNEVFKMCSVLSHYQG